MAVTAFWYVNAFETMLNKEQDYLTDAIGVILTLNAYTPNQDTHDFGDDITDEVAEANGYLQGLDGTGELLTTKTHSNVLNVSGLDADDPAWTATGAGFTARRMVIVDVDTGVAATDPLMTWMDFGQDETASGGGTFTVAFAAAPGLATITPADAAGFPA